MKNLIFLFSFIFALSTQLMAQTIMNIHQSNGTVLQIPLNTIDSITYTNPNPGNLATITTAAIGNITASSASSGGNISSSGGSLVTQRGVCWSTSPNPTTANNSTNNGSGTGNFTSNLSGLTANTTYYVRAYAINSAGTAYGNQLSFISTGSSAGSITALNCASATNNGTLTAGTAASGVSSAVPYTGGNGGTHSGQTVNSTGVIGLTATLTAGSFANGSGSLTYTISGTPASAGTASFALNIGGQNCNLSLSVANIVGSITALNCTSATNNGTLTAGTAASGVSSAVPYTGGNGGTYSGQTVNSTGVTGLTATLAAGSFANGSGSLTYTISGTPASGGTASFFLNIGGRYCDLSLSVGIVSNPGPGVNYNGYTYPTFILGNGQEWMDQNLRTTQYNDGTSIPLVTDSLQWRANYYSYDSLPMMCWYNNDQATYTANNFGALYNWYAINPLTNGNKNVCPTGWHVPSDAEWTIFIDYLDPDAVGGEYANTAGSKMKSTGTQFWLSPNTDATNESGFSGLPGGFRNDYGIFEITGSFGLWWSSTEFTSRAAWNRYLNNSNGFVQRISSGFVGKGQGQSVRCLRD